MRRKAKVALISTGIICCPLLAQAQNAEQSTQKLTTDTVMVTATKVERPLEEIPYSVSSVTEKEIQRKGAISIADALQDIPGVEVTDGSMAGAKRVSIRGESGARVLIMIDGQKISEQKSMDGSIYMIDPAIVERVEVIKGPASVLYGSEAIGGVVNIITKKGGEKPVQIELGVTHDTSTDGWKENVSLAGKLGRVGYRLYGSFSDQGNRKTPEETLSNTAYREMNGKVYLDYQWDDAKVAFSYEHFKDSLNVHMPASVISYPIEAFYQDLPTWSRNKYSLSFEARNLAAPLVKVSGNAYYQKTLKDFIMEMDLRPIPAMKIETRNRSKNNLESIGTQLQADWLLFNDHYVITGFDFTRDMLTADEYRNTTQRGPGPFPIVTNNIYKNKAESDIYSVYLQDEWSFAKDFILTAGFRQTWVSTKLKQTNDPILKKQSESDNNIVGSVGLVYNGIENSSLRLLWAQGYRNATLQQQYMGTPHGQAGMTYGNPDLEPEKSNNIEFGIRYDNGGFYLDTALFGNQTKDLITTVNYTAGNPGDLIFGNVDKSTSYGVDSSIGYRFTELGLTPYATISYIERKFQSANLRTWKTGIPTVQGRLGLRYEQSPSSNFGYFLNLFGRFADSADYEGSAGNVEKYPGWVTLNLGGGIMFGDKQQHNLSVNINNLLDKEYNTARQNIPQAGIHAVIGLNMAF